MTKAMTFVAVAMVALGCTSSKRINGPDGSGEWYQITCHRTQANCVEEAGNLCPHGYVTDREGGGSTPFAIENGAGGTTRGSTYTGEMLVKCR